MTQTKLSAEQATVLNTYSNAPATKRYAYTLMLSGKNLEEVILACQGLAKKESEIKNGWFRAMTKEMANQRFDGTTYELQKLLEDKAVIPEKILSRANKHMKDMAALGKPKSRELQVFIKILERYLKKLTNFNSYGYKMMAEGKSLKEIAAVAGEKDRQERIDNERRLWRIQCVHHCQTLLSFGDEIESLLMEQALDKNGIKDAKTRELQILLVYQTYTDKAHNYASIKQICYRYIRDYVLIMKSIHPTLVEYTKADEWASEETVSLYLDREVSTNIVSAGQASLVYMPFHRMAEEIRKQEKFSVLDKNVLSIEGFYGAAMKKVTNN